MKSDLTNTLQIRTPEGVVFSFTLASPISRGLAVAIDLACISLISSTLGNLLQLITILSLELAQALQIVLFFLISIGYSVACEWRFQGQTLGKKVLRLQVIDQDGLKLQFSQIMLRNLLRVVDLLLAFYLLGGVVCAATQRGQRLGDLAARTVVICHTEVALPDIDQILPGKFNSFLAHPHLVARVRQLVSPAELDIALQALLRRNEFTPQSRLEVFASLASHFQTLVPFPEEDCEGLTQEQYVINIIHLMLKSHAR